MPERKTVRITVEFGEEPMGSTNMVAYMWNTDRKALFVKIIDAIEVVAAPLEPVMQAADPEPSNLTPNCPQTQNLWYRTLQVMQHTQNPYYLMCCGLQMTMMRHKS